MLYQRIPKRFYSVPVIKSHWLLVLLSGYLVAVLNLPFFEKIYGYVFSLETVSPLFVISLPIFLFCLIYLFFSLTIIRGLTKIIWVPLLIISAVLAYATMSYGIIFDPGMIENFAETDVAEASSYLSVSSVLFVVLAGVVPALLLLRSRIVYQTFWREVGYRVAGIVAALAVFCGIALGLYQDYAAVGRNNQHVQNLIVPSKMLYSLGKYSTRNLLKEDKPFQLLGQDVTHNPASKKPTFMVVVLGETARASNYHYNGYPRNTNRYTEPLGMISLGKVESCGTATAVSVPCMFSFLNRSNYDKKEALNQSNVLDVLKHSGIEISWIDNNSGCKGVCKGVDYVKIDTHNTNPLCDGEFCFDEVLLQHVERLLKQPGDQDRLVVLHVIGSHGPTYYRRYPDSYRTFTPDCPRSDIQNCTQEEIVNTYDNTILYTDYVISEVINRLKQEEQRETALLYMSDHGESLGENGIFLHGMPYKIAPQDQTHVPALLWVSTDFSQDHQLTGDCLSGAQAGTISQDFLSHSLLGLMSVDSDIHQSSLDFTSPCRAQVKTIEANAVASAPAVGLKQSI